MARASSVVSARAMAPGSLTQQRNRTKLADSCSATVAGFYAAVDTMLRSFHIRKRLPPLPTRIWL